MCMLCVIPPNTFPSRTKLENSALNNPHGFGYGIAIPSEHRILTFRSMNPDECINKFFEDRAKYPEHYAIWHARFATHGSNTLDNCHPFKVGTDSQTYLAHNGILPVIENLKDDRSDTRIFAEDLLPAIGGARALDNPQVWNMLEDFTTGSKVAVLTVNPKARHQLYLLHEEKGYFDEDGTNVWWSNTSCHLYSYGNYASGVTAATSHLEDEEEIWLECGVCDGVMEYWVALTNNAQYFCSRCGSCYDCSMTISDCLCYRPSDYQQDVLYDYRTGKEKYYGGKYLKEGGWTI